MMDFIFNEFFFPIFFIRVLFLNLFDPLVEPFLDENESTDSPLWEPLLEFLLEGLGDLNVFTSTICTKPSFVSCNF